jgi:hypothetical protein
LEIAAVVSENLRKRHAQFYVVHSKWYGLDVVVANNLLQGNNNCPSVPPSKDTDHSDIEQIRGCYLYFAVISLFQGEIMSTFDLDCVTVGFNGTRPVALPRAIRAITKGYNLILPETLHFSARRMIKYA